MSTHLPHDCDGCLVDGLGNPVLDQVEHVLVVQKPDQVEGAETGSTAQGQISDHHGTSGKKEHDYLAQTLTISLRMETTYIFNLCQFGNGNSIQTLLICVSLRIKRTCDLFCDHG